MAHFVGVNLGCVSMEHGDSAHFHVKPCVKFYCDSYGLQKMAPMFIQAGSLVPGAEEERLVHTDALPVN